MFWLNQLIELARAAEVDLLAPLPETEKVSSLTGYLEIIFPLFVQVAALLAVIVIAFNGLEYMFSKLPGMKGQAKGRIWAAVGGLILALTAYLILQTINPDLTKNQFEIPKSGENGE